MSRKLFLDLSPLAKSKAYKIPVVVIKVQIKGVKVLEGGQGVDVQLEAHVLEHKVQPHLLQLVILVRLESDFS